MLYTAWGCFINREELRLDLHSGIKSFGALLYNNQHALICMQLLLRLKFCLTVSSLQTKTDNIANSVDPDVHCLPFRSGFCAEIPCFNNRYAKFKDGMHPARKLRHERVI